MPKNTKIKSVLIIGAGPIIIGQACEFDYSGVQACKALREEGIRVILVNSNPATIMTDPEMADKVYIEPIHWRNIEKIIITASGGPFLKTSFENLRSATPEQACNHPNWKMGKKISVDSATMMNKGLEIIEASLLFELSASQIEVVIHPQSIVHSFVYFDDGSVLSQLGLPDMRSAIAYALSHPGRIKSGVKALDLTQQESLEFHQPDLKKYKCLELAYLALEQGKSAPGTLNAANEVAVNAFLKNKIGFLDIPEVVEKTLQEVSCQNLDTLESVVENDQLSRKIAQSFVKSSD